MASFKAYKEGKANLTTFAENLKSNIPPASFFLPTKNQIAWECLKYLRFKNIKNTSTDITAACKKIIDIEPFLKNSGGDPVDIFLKVFLDIDDLPVMIKLTLETEARKHLHQIESLINHYNLLPIIKKNSVEPEKPRNHEERTQLEFFRRIQVKKENIVQYLTSGALDARAISKAAVKFKDHHDLGPEELQKQLMFHMDFPYADFLINKKIEFGIDMEKLDYRQINTIRNKRSWVKGKYSQNGGYSKEFNRAVKSSIDPKKFFKGIVEDLKSVPIVSGRLPIFKELNKLFSDKYWFGFFALALPQVEGIFNEMVELVTQKKSIGTLTDKVHLVRPYYDNSEFYFDYYEYYLPKLRNQFAHSGKLDDAEIKCYYIMLDLKDLLATCLNLDAPMSKLAAYLKEGANGLHHIGNISEIIILINKIIEQKQLPLIEKDLNRFIYKDVAVNIDLKNFFEKLMADFSLALSTFEYHLELGIQVTGLTGFKLFRLTPAEVVANMLSIEESYREYYFLMDEDLKLLLDTNNVLHYFEKLFPKLPQSVLGAIHAFSSKFIAELRILSILNAKAKFELPDNYLLHRQTMTHVLS